MYHPPDSCSVRNQTQDLVHTRQTPSQLSYIKVPVIYVLDDMSENLFFMAFSVSYIFLQEFHRSSSHIQMVHFNDFIISSSSPFPPTLPPSPSSSSFQFLPPSVFLLLLVISLPSFLFPPPSSSFPLLLVLDKILLCSLVWSQTCHPPASASSVLSF